MSTSGTILYGQTVSDSPAFSLLGGSVFVKPTTSSSGLLTLYVSVANSSDVPPEIVTAVITLEKLPAANGSDAATMPKQTMSVALRGEGLSRRVDFVVPLTEIGNRAERKAVYRVTLERLENIPTGMTIKIDSPRTLDVSLAPMKCRDGNPAENSRHGDEQFLNSYICKDNDKDAPADK